MASVTLDSTRVLVACEAVLGVNPQPPFARAGDLSAYQAYCLARCAYLDPASQRNVTLDEHMAVAIALHYPVNYPVGYLPSWAEEK